MTSVGAKDQNVQFLDSQQQLQGFRVKMTLDLQPAARFRLVKPARERQIDRPVNAEIVVMKKDFDNI